MAVPSHGCGDGSCGCGGQRQGQGRDWTRDAAARAQFDSGVTFALVCMARELGRGVFAGINEAACSRAGAAGRQLALCPCGQRASRGTNLGPRVAVHSPRTRYEFATLTSCVTALVPLGVRQARPDETVR